MPASAGGGRALCGAKTRSGKPCRSAPMANGRCRMHGGAASAAAAKAAKPHIYAGALNPEEATAWRDVPINNLEEAIRFQWIVVKRAAAAWLQAEQAPDDLSIGFDLAEVKRTSEGAGAKAEKAGAAKERQQITLRRPDFRSVYDAAVARLAHLMQLQAKLQGEDPGDPADKARQIKVALDKIEDLSGPAGALDPA